MKEITGETIKPCRICGHLPSIYDVGGDTGHFYVVRCETNELFNSDRNQYSWNCNPCTVAERDLTRAIDKWNIAQEDIL